MLSEEEKRSAIERLERRRQDDIYENQQRLVKLIEKEGEIYLDRIPTYGKEFAHRTMLGRIENLRIMHKAGIDGINERYDEELKRRGLS